MSIADLEALHGVPTDLIVGGKTCAAAEGGTLQVTNPGTGAELTSLADGTVADATACRCCSCDGRRMGRHLTEAQEQDAAVVDSDLDAAIEGAMIAKMRNGGEACTAANRCYVEAPVVEKFTAGLNEAMRCRKFGPGDDPSVAVGPLICAGAREKVATLVTAALATGATLHAVGGVPAGNGYFYPPTVLSNLDPSAEILQTEIFGPIAPVVTFTTREEAIRLANQTEYGMVTYLYTSDLARGLRVSERLEAGMVGLNRGLVSDPAAPVGGVKRGGLGREGGIEGLHAFTESTYISVSC